MKTIKCTSCPKRHEGQYNAYHNGQNTGRERIKKKTNIIKWL